MEDNKHLPQNSGQTIIINQNESGDKNKYATSGFTLSLVALFLSWVPVLGWVLWVFGLVFSIVGLFKKPRSLAIAGIIISFFWLIVLFFVLGAIGAALSF